MRHILLLLLVLLSNQIIYGQSKTVDSVKKSQEIFVEYEKGASFPGGDRKMFCFLFSNLKKEIVSDDSLPEGKVFAKFSIDTIGQIHNVRIVRHYNKLVDNEIIRVIEAMPNWAPYEVYIGYPNGYWIKKEKEYTLPIKIPYKNQCP